MKFKSPHKLKFKTAPHLIGGAPTGMEKFIVGTCHGLWVQHNLSVDMWAVINEKPGNGHMDDVIEWFFQIAKAGNVPIRVMDISNKTFYDELVEKWKFLPTDHPNVLMRIDFVKPVKTKTDAKAEA